jgi:hypothetical protein
MQNGEIEKSLRVYQLPGRNTGRLAVCKSGNVYNVMRGNAWFVFDYKELGIHPDSKQEIIAAWKEQSLRRSAEALAEGIQERLIRLQAKEGSE